MKTESEEPPAADPVQENKATPLIPIELQLCQSIHAERIWKGGERCRGNHHRHRAETRPDRDHSQYQERCGSRRHSRTRSVLVLGSNSPSHVLIRRGRDTRRCPSSACAGSAGNLDECYVGKLQSQAARLLPSLLDSRLEIARSSTDWVEGPLNIVQWHEDIVKRASDYMSNLPNIQTSLLHTVQNAGVQPLTQQLGQDDQHGKRVMLRPLRIHQRPLSPSRLQFSILRVR